MAVAVVLLIIVLAAIAVVVTALGRRPRSRARGGLWFTRGQRIRHAAAQDVEAIRKDARGVAPDAPGNHTDDL
jgi:hypothetical protein